MKKIAMYILLSALLLISVTTFFACNVQDGLKFRLINNEAYEVYCSENVTQTDIKIPVSYKGLPVTWIGLFKDCTNITSIIIPSSITYITNAAFSGCSGLESITVASENVVYKSVNNCLLTIDCKTLILGCKTSIIPNSVIDIGPYAFSGCINLDNIEIPDSVINIREWAFRSCTGLKSIIIPSSVISIGPAVFTYCANLTIYCEAESLPDEWDAQWNLSGRNTPWNSWPVFWGYTLSTDKII